MAVAGEQNIYVHRERKKGFEEAMAGAPGVQAEYVLNWEYLKQVEKLAQDGIRTAFACTADDFALDIMKYLKEKGLRAPADYGIVGFDNVDTLKYITPQLVTVSNKVDAVAKAAVQMLFALINAGQEQADEKSQVAEQEAQRRVQILPHELIDGETLQMKSRTENSDALLFFSLKIRNLIVNIIFVSNCFTKTHPYS
ncbi:MAG: substrate-binding domain-containing protein [Lachnospiraceae bacterium]